MQKVHLAAHDVPLPEFMSVPDLAAAKDAGLRFGYPYMLKNRKLAYDGKGTEVALPVRRLIAWMDYVLKIALHLYLTLEDVAARAAVAAVLRLLVSSSIITLPYSTPPHPII